jgi:hypothetical protein
MEKIALVFIAASGQETVTDSIMEDQQADRPPPAGGREA